ncbi:unnamed protein product [Cyprideis torosa]|uniref:Uncharacterized protein n=1 Tax=Cyprideis torosa TaxID=163714 RepID=A0A7R8WDQ0_9CRUS|nr:unnamed protein product [Cyprideis torosa]CAG0894962.1 unnamed protein product [Cyprideis torosa]
MFRACSVQLICRWISVVLALSPLRLAQATPDCPCACCHSDLTPTPPRAESFPMTETRASNSNSSFHVQNREVVVDKNESEKRWKSALNITLFNGSHVIKKLVITEVDNFPQTVECICDIAPWGYALLVVCFVISFFPLSIILALGLALFYFILQIKQQTQQRHELQAKRKRESQLQKHYIEWAMFANLTEPMDFQNEFREYGQKPDSTDRIITEDQIASAAAGQHPNAQKEYGTSQVSAAFRTRAWKVEVEGKQQNSPALQVQGE